MSAAVPFPVSLCVSAEAPAQVMWLALSELLGVYEQHPGSSALRVDLHADLQSPIEAIIEVPIAANIRTDEAQRSFDIDFRARDNPGYYPRFRGRLRLQDKGHGGSLFELVGSYEVPLGSVGRALDTTLFAGAAAASLDRFLQRLVRDAETRVREQEERYAKSALHFHA